MKGNNKQEIEIWWWDDAMVSFNKTQRKLWNKVAESMQQRKMFVRGKPGLCLAKRKTREEKFSQLGNNDSKSFILKLAKKMKHEN